MPPPMERRAQHHGKGRLEDRDATLDPGQVERRAQHHGKGRLEDRDATLDPGQGAV